MNHAATTDLPLTSMRRAVAVGSAAMAPVASAIEPISKTAERTISSFVPRYIATAFYLGPSGGEVVCPDPCESSCELQVASSANRGSPGKCVRTPTPTVASIHSTHVCAGRVRAHECIPMGWPGSGGPAVTRPSQVCARGGSSRAELRMKESSEATWMNAARSEFSRPTHARPFTIWSIRCSICRTSEAGHFAAS